MTAASMRADCARCAALCCVAFAFACSEEFAIDKSMGAPCPNLDHQYRCRIYQKREQLGFRGCVSYDCYGAGQRVTQEIFGDRSWPDDPRILPQMIRAFLAMREVQSLILMLNITTEAALSREERKALQSFLVELTPTGGWTRESLAAFERNGLSRRVHRFLRSLKRHFDMGCLQCK